MMVPPSAVMVGSDRSGRLLLEVGNGRLQSIFYQRSTLGLSVEDREHCKRFVNGLATDEVDNATELADAITDVFHFCYSLHYFLPPAAVSVFLCPRNVRVMENSPSLWPTMFSVT